jgi:hypothetical protein
MNLPKSKLKRERQRPSVTMPRSARRSAIKLLGSQQLKFKVNVLEALATKGFSFVKAEEVAVPARLLESRRELLDACRSLPPDAYCVDGTRRRCYSRFILLPWDRRLIEWPRRNYYQETAINHESGGVERTFSPLPPSLQTNEFLRSLILEDFMQSPFAAAERGQPFDVGVHVIELTPRRGVEAKATPNCLHKDGEPYTFVHLLVREGVSGGESVVTDNNKNPLFIATLSDPLDTLVVRDESVYHHVMPVTLTAAVGRRVSLLIDFTPMKAATQSYGPQVA